MTYCGPKRAAHGTYHRDRNPACGAVFAAVVRNNRRQGNTVPPSALALAVALAWVVAAADGAAHRNNHHRTLGHPSQPVHFVVMGPAVEAALNVTVTYNHQTLHLNQSSFGRRGLALLFYVDVVVLSKHHVDSQVS
jgi:hypothetical protein